MMSYEWLERIDKTDREYSLPPTADLIRFWRSRSQQAYQCGDKGIKVDAGALMSNRLVVDNRQTSRMSVLSIRSIVYLISFM